MAEALHATKTGRTIAYLTEALGVSRSTLYRDLEFLRAVGLPVDPTVVNGEARYKLVEGRPGLVSPLRVAALKLACGALGALSGTRLLLELEKLQRDLPAMRESVPVIARPPVAVGAPDVVAAVERATFQSRRLVFDYRSARGDAVERREVAPLELRIAKGHLYVVAHDFARGDARTFKVVRMASPSIGESFDRSSFTAPDDRGSVVVWSGDLVDVAVWLSEAVARFASEYPLVDGQRVELCEGGGVVVRARVAGTEEVLRWVLGWGKNAEVIGPPILRERARSELAAALEPYVRGEGRVDRGVSRKLGREGATFATRGAAGQRVSSAQRHSSAMGAELMTHDASKQT